MQRLLYGHWLPGFDGNLLSLQHANDLERIEGIAARRFMHLREQRPWQRDAEVTLHDMVQ